MRRPAHHARRTWGKHVLEHEGLKGGRLHNRQAPRRVGQRARRQRDRGRGQLRQQQLRRRLGNGGGRAPLTLRRQGRLNGSGGCIDVLPEPRASHHCGQVKLPQGRL
jgi:hypothetical protein